MKKLLALVLALVMVFSVAVTASAAGVKLEKHPYEKPNRELPYETWQTVPDSIKTPVFKVDTDWDAHRDADGKVESGLIKLTFEDATNYSVASLINNMKLYDVKTGKEYTNPERKFVFNDKTGKLELNFDKSDIAWLKKNTEGKFMLKTEAPVYKLDKNNKLDESEVVKMEMTFQWDDKTDTASLKGYKIENTAAAAKYSTDGVAVSGVEYYPNGKCKSVTLTHVDGDKVWNDDKATWIGANASEHGYTDDSHTDHRYQTITLNYDEKTGKLSNYSYTTEVTGTDDINADKFTVSAKGDVLKATVDVKGQTYEYMTAEQYAAENGMSVSQVTPDKIGWFASVTVENADGSTTTQLVPCAAPEGYDKFGDTVHLFAKRHWYPENTIGVVGLSLRDEFPGLTDKWINIVPVDLTIQGTQTIELVAGNMFHIGKAFVDVDGDNVTVTYSYTNNVTEAFSECVKWFKNVDEITSEFCENPTSDLVFGQPVSIANDLGGQEVALLYICNSATYYQTFITKQDAPNRYYENLKKWRKSYRPALYELMDRIPE